MSDRIVLANIRLDGHHGVPDEERARPQPFEVDVELGLDLGPAGVSDDLARSVDYGPVYDVVKDVITGRSYRLLEAIADAIARRILETYPVEWVVVRVRKPTVRLGGPLDSASVEIRREAPPR